ncbi:helix-turn-helix domain-containing protein [Streptosporangium roseum]|uniref:helix-turn-helix domain-containing protein n=1 Tax=Streptosporangium roseum TaxID=2001 RepID=UPI0009E05CE5
MTLAEELHFGRTAERLHVTTGRISQTIKKRERRVGAPLFERSGRKVTLTAIGRQLHEVQPHDPLGPLRAGALDLQLTEFPIDEPDITIWPSGTAPPWCGPRPRCWAGPRWARCPPVPRVFPERALGSKPVVYGRTPEGKGMYRGQTTWRARSSRQACHGIAAIHLVKRDGRA